MRETVNGQVSNTRNWMKKWAVKTTVNAISLLIQLSSFIFILFTPHPSSSSLPLIHSSSLLLKKLSSCTISFTSPFSASLLTKSTSFIPISSTAHSFSSPLPPNNHPHSFSLFIPCKVSSLFILVFSVLHTVIFIHVYPLYSLPGSPLSLSLIYTAKKKLNRCSASPHCLPAHTGSHRASPGQWWETRAGPQGRCWSAGSIHWGPQGTSPPERIGCCHRQVTRLNVGRKDG